MNKKSDVLYILPAMLGFGLFWVIPFAASFGYAFIDHNFSARFVGLQNFKSLLENTYFRLALKNTLLFSLLAVSVIMAVSVLLAICIARYAAKFSFIRSAFFLPVLLPSATIVMFWNAYFAEVPPLPSLLCMYLWKYLGLNVMLLLTAITTLDRDMLDAACIDGAGNWKQTFHIILPNITPSLFFTLILSLVNSMKIYRESYLMWGRYPDESVYMLQNYIDNHFAKMNYPNISTAAIFFAVIVYMIVGVLYLLEHRWEKSIWK